MAYDMQIVEWAKKQLWEAGVHWKELQQGADQFASEVQNVVSSCQQDNLMDVEDVLVDLVSTVTKYGTIRSFEQMIARVIERTSGLRSDASPSWENLIGKSNNDDRAGKAKNDTVVQNDMASVVAPDMGPGSDMHIAAMDILEEYGQIGQDVFEFSLGGETQESVAEARGLNRQQVKRIKSKIVRFLKEGEYTLDGTNRRLGTGKAFDSSKSFFPASPDQKKRNWELPEVDHRSTNFVEGSGTRPAYPSTVKITPDLTKGIAPTGDEVGNTGLGYETNIGPDRLLPEDASEVQHGIKTVSWKTYPNGVDTRPQYSQYGNPAKWQPRRDSDESIQKMCNEIFETYDHNQV